MPGGYHVFVVQNSGSQHGVWGPPGVLEGVPVSWLKMLLLGNQTSKCALEMK